MNAEELLVRAVTFKDDLPYQGVKMKVHEMVYPFFLQVVFPPASANEESDVVEDFERYFNNLAKEYMTGWILNTEKKSSENLRSLFNFQKDTDLKKIFSQIARGDDNPAEIFFKVSNVRMQIRRFGNVFGIKMNANSGGEIHKDGTEMLRNFCREQRACLQEFLHSIEFIIPLPKKQGSVNSDIVDFEEALGHIERACYGVQWSTSKTQSIEAIIKHYIDAPRFEEGGPAVGACGKENSLHIHAHLIHLQDDPIKKVPEWRRGNVSETAAAGYEFSSGGDLCLSLQIKGYFADSSVFLKKVDTNLDVNSQQDEMISVGAMIFKQLSAMADNGYKSFECA